MSRHARGARRHGRHAAGHGARGRHARPARGPRRALALAVVPAVLAGGSAAYAYWSATAAGSATVRTASAVPLTVGASTATLSDLYPGRAPVDVGYRVTNPNSYPVRLTRLTALSVASSDAAACPAGTHLTVSSAVTTGVSGGGYVLPTAVTVGPGASVDAVLGSLVSMNSTAPDGCQGRSFTVSLSFTGEQTA